MLQGRKNFTRNTKQHETKLHGFGATSDDDLLISGCWNMVLLTTTKIKG